MSGTTVIAGTDYGVVTHGDTTTPTRTLVLHWNRMHISMRLVKAASLHDVDFDQQLITLCFGQTLHRDDLERVLSPRLLVCDWVHA